VDWLRIVQDKGKWTFVVLKTQGISWTADSLSVYQQRLCYMELWSCLGYEICLETSIPNVFSFFAICTYKSSSLLHEIFVCNLTNTIPCKFVAMIPAVSSCRCLFTLSITHSLTTWSVEIEIHNELLKLRRSVCLFVCKFDNGEIPFVALEGRIQNLLHISRLTDNWLANFSSSHSCRSENVSQFPWALTQIKCYKLQNTTLTMLL
jgi:hypothetical protein